MALQSGKLNPWRLAIVTAIVLAIACWLVYEIGPLELTDESTFETAATVHKVFNLVEGFVWLGVGAVLIWKFRSLQRRSLPAVFAGAAFVLFGVSDFIEIQTGSWFEPTWLLVLNVTCVVSLTACFVWYLALQRRRSSD